MCSDVPAAYFRDHEVGSPFVISTYLHTEVGEVCQQQQAMLEEGQVLLSSYSWARQPS